MAVVELAFYCLSEADTETIYHYSVLFYAIVLTSSSSSSNKMLAKSTNKLDRKTLFPIPIFFFVCHPKLERWFIDFP
jgi:hypothetical protein